MSQMAAPSPIPGEAIDPRPKARATTIRRIDDRSRVVGVAFRAFLRFTLARAFLLAAGTTYYVFLAVFALIALAFGLAALIGSQYLTDLISQAITTAFPGAVGNDSIDTEQLRALGSTTSIFGLLVLLYSGAGAMTAASNSIHLIYGAPPDPRNIVWSRGRLIGWMIVIAPLILLSFAPSLLVTGLAKPMLDAVGLPDAIGQAVLIGLSLVVSFALNYLVIYWFLSDLGGIRPSRYSRVIGSAFGATGEEILKYSMVFIIAWAMSKPQYGAFTAPIATLFVLYLLTIVLYASASITAAVAEKDEPLPDERAIQGPSDDE